MSTKTARRAKYGTETLLVGTQLTVHVTDDDVRFCDSPGMLIRKTAKPCINNT